MMNRTILALWLSLSAAVAPGCTKDGVAIDQAPFTVKATSKLTAAFYLDWSNAAGSAFSFDAADGSKWLARKPTQPPCLEACSSAPKGADCRLQCKLSAPMVKKVDPGESVSFTWQGDFYMVFDDHCSAGSCFVMTSPGPGRHRAKVCGADDWTCTTKPCPQPTGTFQGELKGDLRCFNAELVIPFEEQELEIVLEEVQTPPGG
jgi:hypothetical protein